jgi:hypothetical protein
LAPVFLLIGGEPLFGAVAEWLKAQKRAPRASLCKRRAPEDEFGEVAEWLKAHAR